MSKVYVSTVLDAPVSAVWKLVGNFNGLATWHPAVIESRIVDGGSQGLSTSSILARAPINSAFRGVALVSVPEPSSLLLMGLGSLMLPPLIRLRRLQASIRFS